MDTLWRITVVTPSECRQVVELRAASQALAIERVLYWRPEYRIDEDAHGVPLIERRPTMAAA